MIGNWIWWWDSGASICWWSMDTLLPRIMCPIRRFIGAAAPGSEIGSHVELEWPHCWRITACTKSPWRSHSTITCQRTEWRNGSTRTNLSKRPRERSCVLLPIPINENSIRKTMMHFVLSGWRVEGSRIVLPMNPILIQTFLPFICSRFS